MGVGKTCIAVRFLQDTFNALTPSTIGAAYFTKILTVDGTQVKLEIWDTAGQERYRSLGPMYYLGANAGIIVYDMTTDYCKSNQKQGVLRNYELVPQFIENMRQHADPNCVLALVGTKKDLCDNQPSLRAKTTQEGEQLTADAQLDVFCEVSSLTGEGVDQLFEAVTSQLLKKQKLLLDSRRGVTLGDQLEKKKSCC